VGDAAALIITQIDAFADAPFTGNPAAVVVLDEPADDTWMQSVAAEVNLSETAFVRPLSSGSWSLRWFTPTIEVDLCGHATLATAHHLWRDVGLDDPTLHFETRSGTLRATRLDEGWIELDFPADPTRPVEPPPGLIDALGVPPAHVVAVSAGRDDLLVELATPEAVVAAEPDHRALGQLPLRGISVSAAGRSASDPALARYDVVSRFFAPGSGVPEDPVTGSAHCTLGPYWGERLGRTELLAHQASRRGGVVRVRAADPDRPWQDRVRIAGRAVHALRRR
jgi:PhzF family phenazine biosynthesis protein